MKSAPAACLLALLLAGCASDGGDRRSSGDHRPPPPSASLFISPSGQPFRAGPGEPYPVVKWFAQADKNGDGRLDRAEFRADALSFFHQLDENGDGVIDGFEVGDYEQKIAPEITGAYGDDSGHGGRFRRGPDRQGGGNASSAAVLQGAAVFNLLNDPEPVAAADLDLSGHITLSEFIIVTDRRFDQLDVKHLGYLTLADLPKTTAQVMAAGGKPGKDDSARRASDQGNKR